MATVKTKINVGKILSKALKEPDWLKAAEGKFMVNEKPLGHELIGQIKDIKMQYTKWVDGKSIKKDENCPEEERTGFDLEMTIYVHVNGTCYGLTLPKKSMKKNFCPYLEMLEARNIDVADVNTRITVTEVKNRDFAFHIFSFALDETESVLSSAA